MRAFLKKINLRVFLLNVILPTLLTIGLFITLIFGYIIPAFERNMLKSKEGMIRELVNAANGIASQYYLQMCQGLISEEAAQSAAVSQIAHLRYGVDNKDYFWITDMRPVMIMHPYRTDLNGQDLTEFRDPKGKALFVEMVQQIQKNGEGFVKYEWQWMDDSLSIVPKISYVQAFKPWGWIIGTGVYIEDVKNEIASIKKRLTLVSLAITACMAFLLVLIARNNLKVEIKRDEAERELHISREKYKALVEASTEGTAMFLEDECIFSNKKFQQLLGIGPTDHLSADLSEIIVPYRVEDIDKVRRFISSDDNFILIETILAPVGGASLNVLLSLSKVTLAGKYGLIVVVKELSRDDMSDEELSGRGRQMLALADASGAGIFKCTAGKKARFLDVNDHMVSMLGYTSKENLLKLDLSDLVDDDTELRRFINALTKERFSKDFVIRLKRNSGLPAVVAITAIAEVDPNGDMAYLYGTMVDISRQKEKEALEQQLKAEMQGQLLFMNQPVKSWVREIVSCETTLPVVDAAKLMTNFKTDVILVRSSTGEYLGLLTDAEIRERVVAEALSTDRPVYEFMTAPLISIGELETLSQAVILMQENGVAHLGVKDSDGRIAGIVRKEELVNLQHNTSAGLSSAISSVSSVSALKAIYRRLPPYVNALSESGAHSSVITSAITDTSNAIGAKLEQFIIRELGAPPAPYVFIAMGSEGRCEQTLFTDQDNAIIYMDIDSEKKDVVREYFKNYGQKMCSLLNEVGFAYCSGNIMANNPRWNQPLSEWRKYYVTWITTPEPQNLLESAIFFDFRPICGDRSLVTVLENHVRELLRDNPSFLVHLAREGMSYRTPLGLLGNIQTESDEEHGKNLNIKNPLRVIVNLVRLYAMKHQLAERNTIKRIQRLYEINAFSNTFYRDILYAYDHLLTLQLRIQASAYRQGKSITNYIDLSSFSTIELNNLKSVFSQLGTFQNKTKYDFGVRE